MVLTALQLQSEIFKEKKVKKRFILLSTFFLTSVFSQEDFQFTFEPSELQIQLGESKKVTIRLIDKKQNLVKSSFSMYSAHDPGIGPTPDWPGTSLSISPRVSDETGEATVSIEPNRSGTLKLKVRGTNGTTGEMIVVVPKPAVKKIDISAIPSKVYVGTFLPLKFKIIDASNNERNDVELSISSSDDKKGRVDAFNTFEAKKTGTVKVSVKAEKISETFKICLLYTSDAADE